jgi:hypothetical protein
MRYSESSGYLTDRELDMETHQGYRSMQYGLSNHLTAPEPCKRGLAETVAIKRENRRKNLNESLKEETSTKEPTG